MERKLVEPLRHPLGKLVGPLIGGAAWPREDADGVSQRSRAGAAAARSAPARRFLVGRHAAAERARASPGTARVAKFAAGGDLLAQGPRPADQQAWQWNLRQRPAAGV